MKAKTTTDPISLAAGAMEQHCDNLGIPMPSPGLARALAEVAAPIFAAAERERIAVRADCLAATVSSGTGAAGERTEPHSHAVALLEEALRLRMNATGTYLDGQRWRKWDRECESYLRSLAPGEQP